MNQGTRRLVYGNTTHPEQRRGPGSTTAAKETDGFNISPYIVPGGLDEIVEWRVPELQERGVYRTECTSTTLRSSTG